MGAPRSSAPPRLTLLLPRGAASVLASPRPLSRSVFDLFCLLKLYVIKRCGRFLKLAQSNSAICRSLFLLTKKKLSNNCYSDSGVAHISFFFSRDDFDGEILQTCFSRRFFNSLTLNCNIRRLTLIFCHITSPALWVWRHWDRGAVAPCREQGRADRQSPGEPGNQTNTNNFQQFRLCLLPPHWRRTQRHNTQDSNKQEKLK